MKHTNDQQLIICRFIYESVDFCYENPKGPKYVLIRPRPFQWYWNSAANPWTKEHEQWQKYTDVENEIIEDAFKDQKLEVEIDDNYVINFQHQVQYKKGDNERQRSVKRMTLDSDRNGIHLRQDSFSLPVTFLTGSSTYTAEQADHMWQVRDYGMFVSRYEQLMLYDSPNSLKKTIADVIEDVAAGIMKEGNALGETHEAKWMAEQLLAVKQLGINSEFKQNQNRIPSQIGETCVYLYTKESFWYKLLNHALRDHRNATLEQVKIFGPFCYLTYYYLRQIATPSRFTVYRGLTLNDAQRQEFMIQGDLIRCTSFTSTSRNRSKAEQFGDTLLISDLGAFYPLEMRPCGVNISYLSDFPGEEEYLVWPQTFLQFDKYEFDNEKAKHLIYLQASPRNW